MGPPLLSSFAPKAWARAMQVGMAITKYSSYGFPVLRLIGWVILSAILMATFNFGIKTDFTSATPNNSGALVPGVNRTYDDGFVQRDISGNSGGMTWNWGYMDIASFSFYGCWAIPAGRGGLTVGGNDSDIGEYASWLMFGGVSRSSLLDADQSLTCAQLKIPAATPPPKVYTSLPFHVPFIQGEGSGVPGSCRMAIEYTARLMVPISRRTMYGTVRPSDVVVIATSAGRGLAGSSGLNGLFAAPPPKPRK